MAIGYTDEIGASGGLNMHFHVVPKDNNPDNKSVADRQFTYKPGLTANGFVEFNHKSTLFKDNVNKSGQWYSFIGFSLRDKGIMIEKGKTVKVSLTGIDHNYRDRYEDVTDGESIFVSQGDLNKKIFDNLIKVNLQVESMTGVRQVVPQDKDSLYLDANGNLSFKGVINNAPFDVKDVELVFYYKDVYTTTVYDGASTYKLPYYTLNYGFENTNFSLVKEDDSVGFLSGIIEWLKKIVNGITNIGSGITNVFNKLVELPGEIWQFISDGLKELFIPSAEDMEEVVYKWDNLFKSRFGALYQIGVYLTKLGETVLGLSERADTSSGQIDFPKVTVNLAGTPYSFGGYTVQIVPDKFDFLIDIVKSLISCVCTLAFINGLRVKYDELVR